MIDTTIRPDVIRNTPQENPSTTACTKPLSMHENVPVWHDCCCCEAEPRWAALAEELGIDLDAGWSGDKHSR